MSNQKQFKSSYAKLKGAKGLTTYTLLLLVLVLMTFTVFAWFGATISPFDGTVTMATIKADVVLYDDEIDATSGHLRVLGQQSSFTADSTASMYNYGTYPVNGSNTFMTNYLRITNTCELDLKAYVKYLFTYLGDDDTFFDYYYFLITDVTDQVVAYQDLVQDVDQSAQPSAMLSLYNEEYSSSFTSAVERVASIYGDDNVKQMQDLRKNSQICPEIISKGDTRYFRIDFCCYDMPSTSQEGVQFSFSSLITLKQSGAPGNEDEDGLGEETEVSDGEAFLLAVAASNSGDTLRLTKDIEVNSSVTITSRLNLDLNGHTLTIAGDLVYETMSAGKCCLYADKINADHTYSQLLIGGNFTVNMPNAEFEICGIQGTDNIVLNNEEDNPDATFTVNCVRDTNVYTAGNADNFLRGLVLTDTQIVIKQSSISSKIADVVLHSNTRLEVGQGSIVASVYNANGAHDVEIVNKGTVSQINLSTLIQSNSSSGDYYEIEIYNEDGNLTSKGENLNSAILLPSWSVGMYSHSQNPASGTPNTYIYTTILDWYVRPTTYFTQNDIVRSGSSVDLVTFIDNGEYRISLKETDFVEETIGQYLTQYFLNVESEGVMAGDKLEDVYSLTIYTYDNVTLGGVATGGNYVNDWEFMRTRMPNLQILNLAFAELANDQIPDGAFDGKSSLETITFPTTNYAPNGYSIGARAFAGTSLKEINLTSLCTSIGTDAFKVGEELGVAQTDWLVVNWTDTSSMSSSLLNALNVDRTVVFMRTAVYNNYRATSDRQNDSWFFSVYEAYTQKIEDTTHGCIYYLTTISGNTVKVSYYSGAIWEGTVAPTIQSTYNVVEIGQSAYYHAFRIDDKASYTSCLLSEQCTVIGADAFRNANFTQLNLGGVYYVGDYAFEGASITLVTARTNFVNVTMVGDFAFANTVIGAIGNTASVLELSAMGQDKLALGTSIFENATVRNTTLVLNNLTSWDNTVATGATFSQVSLDLSGTTEISAYSFVYDTNTALFDATYHDENNLYLYNCYVIEANALNGIQVNTLAFGIEQSLFSTQSQVDATCSMGDGTNGILVNSETYPTAVDTIVVDGWLPEMVTGESGNLKYYLGGANTSFNLTICNQHANAGKVWDYFVYDGDGDTTAVKTLTMDETVTSVGKHSFAYVDVENYSLDLSAILSYDEYAFDTVQFPYLTQVVFSDGEVSARAFAFSTFNILQTLDLSTVSQIGVGAFYQANFPALSKLDVSNTQSIGATAFYQATVATNNLLIDATDVLNVGENALGIVHNGLPTADGATSGVVIGISDQTTNLSACSYSKNLFYNGGEAGFTYLTINGGLPTNSARAFAGKMVGDTTYSNIDVANCTSLPEQLFSSSLVGALNVGQIRYMTNVTADANNNRPNFNDLVVYSYDETLGKFNLLAQAPTDWTTNYSKYFTTEGDVMLSLGEETFGGILWHDIESGWWETFFTHVDAVSTSRMFAYGRFSTVEEFTLDIDVGVQAFYSAQFDVLTKLAIESDKHAVTIMDQAFYQADLSTVEEIDLFTAGYNLFVGNEIFVNVGFDALTTIYVTTNVGTLQVGENLFKSCQMPQTNDVTITTGQGNATIGNAPFGGSTFSTLQSLTLTSGAGALIVDGYLLGTGDTLPQLQTLTVTTGQGAVSLAGLINNSANLTSLAEISIETGSTNVVGITAGALTISDVAIANVNPNAVTGLTEILVQPGKGAIEIYSIANGLTFPQQFNLLTLASSTFNTEANLTFESGVLVNCTAQGLTGITFAVNDSSLIVDGTFADSNLSSVQIVLAQINSTGSLTLADGLFEGCNLTSMAICDLAGAKRVGAYLFKNATLATSVEVDLRNVLQVGEYLFDSSANVTLGTVYVGLYDNTLKAHALNPSNYNNDCFYAGVEDGQSIFSSRSTVTVTNLVIDGELPTYQSEQILGLAINKELTYTKITITENCTQLPDAVFYESAGTITIGNVDAVTTLGQTSLRTTSISIGARAFQNVTLTDSGTNYFASLCDNVTFIGESAFESTEIGDTEDFNFANLTVSQTAIGARAFFGSKLSTSAIIFKQGITIGASAFEGVNFNSQVAVSAQRLVSVGERAFANTVLHANSTFDFVGTTTIGDRLFAQAQMFDTPNAVSVNMFNVNQLGKYLFEDTAILSTLTVGMEVVANSAYYASGENNYSIFGGETSLQTLYVADAIPTRNVSRAFGLSQEQETSASLNIGTVLISNAVASLPDYLFVGAQGKMTIGTLQLGDQSNVITQDFSVGQRCFQYVTFDSFALYFEDGYDNATVVESYAFQGATLGNETNQNTSVAILLSHVTEIQANAFDGATAYFGGANVTIVGATVAQNAFSGAKLYNIATLMLRNTTVDANAFANSSITGITELTFDNAVLNTNAFNTATITGTNFNLVAQNGTQIKESCFAGATLTGVRNVSVSTSSIEAKGFANIQANSATTITLENLSNIGVEAFYQAKLAGVTQITIDTAPQLGDYAFNGATISSLVTLSINNVPQIGTAVLQGATLGRLATLSITCGESYLPSHTTTIGENAFAGLSLGTVTTLTIVNYEDVKAMAFYNSTLSGVTTFTLTCASGYPAKLGDKAFANVQLNNLRTDGLNFTGYHYIGNTTEDSYVFANAFKNNIDLDLTEARVIGKYSFASCQLGTVTMGNQTYANGGEYSWGGGYAIFTGVANENVNYSSSTIQYLDVVAPMPTTAMYVFGADTLNMTVPTYTTVRFGETVSRIPDYAFNAYFDPSANATRSTVTINAMYLMYQPDYNNGNYFYVGNQTHAAKFMDESSQPANWVFAHAYTYTQSGLSSSSHIVFYLATVGSLYVPAGCVDDYEKSALGSYYCTSNTVATTLFWQTGNKGYQCWGSGTYFAFVSADRDTVPTASNNGLQNKFKALSTASGNWTYTILGGNEIALVSYEGTGNTITIPATLAGYNVVEVSSSLLQSTTATTVVIGANVRTIGVDGMSSTIRQFNVNNNARFSASYYYQIDTTTGNGNNQTTTTTYDTFTTPQTNTNNVTYTLLGCALYNGDGTTLIRYAPGSTATTFTVPSTVRVVGSYAFGGVTLQTLTFEANTMLFLSSNAFRTTTIQNYVFRGTTAPILAGDDVFYMYRSVNIHATPSAYTYTTAYRITLDSATAYNNFVANQNWSILAPIMSY